MQNLTSPDDNTCDVLKIYSSYTPAQKKATLKYREQNKDKINSQRKEYYKKKVEEDPLFLEYKRKKAKEYYDRKKASKSKSPITLSEPVKVVDVKPVEPEPVVEPVVEPDKKVKVKKTKLKTIVTPEVLPDTKIKEPVVKPVVEPVVELLKSTKHKKVKKV